MDVKYMDKILGRLEYDWARKRGKGFPLSSADQYQYQKEMSIQRRFWELSNIIAKSKKISKSTNGDNETRKPWPLWTYDDVVHDKMLFNLMSETDTNKAVEAIEDTVHCPLAIYFGGTTVLSLSDKEQIYNESGNLLLFDRAAIAVSSLRNTTKHIFIDTDESVGATFYVGYYNVQSEEDEDIWEAEHIPGFLVCRDRAIQSYAIELPELSALLEIEEGKEYLFTFYSQEHDLFIKRLSSLENIDLFSDNDA